MVTEGKRDVTVEPKVGEMHFEDEDRGHEPTEAGGKSKETEFPLQPPEGTSPDYISLYSPVRLLLEFWLPEL